MFGLVSRRRYNEVVARRECLGYKVDDAETSRDEAIAVAARIARRYDRLARIVAAHITGMESAGLTAMPDDLRKALADAGIDLSIEFARLEGRDGVKS